MNFQTPPRSQGSGLSSGQGQAAAWRPPGPLTALSPDSRARGKGLRPNLALAEPEQSRLQQGEAGCLLELHPFPSSYFLNRFVSKALPGLPRLKRIHPHAPTAILGRDPGAGRRHLGKVGPAGELYEGRSGRAILGRSARFGLGRDGHGLARSGGSGHSPATAAADTPPPATPSG